MIDLVDFGLGRTLTDHSFDKIAEEILHDFLILINTKSYQIDQLEFYLNDRSDKLDVFTHKFITEETRLNFQSGQLRLHGSGIDIVLREADMYGGILITGIREIVDDKVGRLIEGPWVVAQELISNIHIDQENSIAIDQKSIIQGSNLEYIKSSRVGLKLGDKDIVKKIEYIHKKWRYIKKPIETNKGKYSICFNLLTDFESENEVRKILNSDLATLRNYKRWIKEGSELELEQLAQLDNSVESKAKIFGFVKR